MNAHVISKDTPLFGNRKKAYLYLLPALLIYVPFVIIPFLQTIALSLTNGTGTKSGEFIGLENYGKIFANPIFWQAFGNNLLWAVIALFLPVTIGLSLAVLLAGRQLLGRTLFRTLLFLPQVLSSVIVAMIWRWMYNPVFGPVNMVLRGVGLEALAHGWLGDRTWALPALAIGYSWAYYGFSMVVFVAALQGIDESLYDAARVDGASALQEFRHITLPGIRFALATVLLFMLVESLKVFDMVYIATKGGPGYSTFVVSYFLYDQTWNQFKASIGASSAVAQTAFIAMLSGGFLWYRNHLQKSLK